MVNEKDKVKSGVSKVVSLPISAMVEPEGFGERDFFAEADNIEADREQEEITEEEE